MQYHCCVRARLARMSRGGMVIDLGVRGPWLRLSLASGVTEGAVGVFSQQKSDTVFRSVDTVGGDFLRWPQKNVFRGTQ